MGHPEPASRLAAVIPELTRVLDPAYLAGIEQIGDQPGPGRPTADVVGSLGTDRDLATEVPTVDQMLVFRVQPLSQQSVRQGPDLVRFDVPLASHHGSPTRLSDVPDHA